MDPQYGLDRPRIQVTIPGREPIGDPRRLGAALDLVEVLLAPPPVHGNDRDEAAAGHEADEQQPPLEFRHQGGRIGLGASSVPAGLAAYTRRR